MSLSTKKALYAMVVCFLSAVCLLASSKAVHAKTLSDLSDLPKIERLAREGIGGDARTDTVVRHELELIRKSLQKVPTAKRARVLHDLAQKTKWGTMERATAFLVCAWYHVDYERSRDYLINCFFYAERRFDGPGPLGWAESTVFVLYALYEHNHDFRILHELVTGHSDGAGAGALAEVKVKAILEHPRGILHVATMSRQGRQISLDTLTRNLDAFDVDKSRAYAVYSAYVRRVASNKRDPLAVTAQSLLREAAILNILPDH